MEMIPQGYPLWCAQLDSSGDGSYEVGSGRVVGWVSELKRDDAANGLFAEPVVAFANEDGAVYHVGFAAESDNFFLGDSRAEAEAMARKHGEEMGRRVREAVRKDP